MNYLTQDDTEFDSCDYTCRYEQQCVLGNEDAAIARGEDITVSYQLVDMGKTAYGFNQPFTCRETESYFNRMAEISGSSIDWLQLNSGHDMHFHRSSISGNLRRQLAGLWPDKKISEEASLAFHFALDTENPGQASRTTGIRNPRVYFLLGRGGVIFPIFFDPFHEINP